METWEIIGVIASVAMALAAVASVILMYFHLQKMDVANRIARERLSAEMGQAYEQVTKLLKEPTPEVPEGECSVRIIKPQSGARVPHAVSMTGTVENLPQGLELWVVNEITRGNYHPDRGPAFIVVNTWNSTAYVGERTRGADTGVEFTIHIVMVSHDTGEKFNEYINMAHKTGNWSGISTIYDGRIVATVKVIRDDFAQ